MVPSVENLHLKAKRVGKETERDILTRLRATLGIIMNVSFKNKIFKKKPRNESKQKKNHRKYPVWQVKHRSIITQAKKEFEELLPKTFSAKSNSKVSLFGGSK